MPIEMSNYRGDADYCVCCTGDCVVGDEVSFDRATFTGSFRSAHFAGFERVSGTIIADSYGREKQQHTFTLLVSGYKIMIKGRNLYAAGTYRRPWADESLRQLARDEKHSRGSIARTARNERKQESIYA
jgi:hypothetical protein